jgi:biopolymer transport protein ExbB
VEVTLVSFTGAALWAIQETQVIGQGQALRFSDIWEGGGFMMWPLGFCLVVGLLIILWKFMDLAMKSGRNRKLLSEVDGLIAQQRMDQALALCQDSDSPAGQILRAGLKRYKEGTERVTQAVENAGAIEVSKLERGLVWLATLSNVAPLLGFLGTVIGMIQAFQAIEIAGEVEATLVAGGIKVALITTASGLTIAIPISVAHNYFVDRVDRIVIDMEESAQKMIDAVHALERGQATVG